MDQVAARLEASRSGRRSLARKSLASEIAFERSSNFASTRNGEAARRGAHARGIGLVGDIPIFVAHDSADVWQHPEAFFLDDEGEPTVVAGVPPDYFSATGQRWGNPLYRWARHAEDGYAWWIARLRRCCGASTRPARSLHRLPALLEDPRERAHRGERPLDQGARRRRSSTRCATALGDLPLIAEDLGAVTPAVDALRDRFRLPGIKILQFAFGTDPLGADASCRTTTRAARSSTPGTHDNDTTVGWFRDEGGDGSTRTRGASAQRARRRRSRYLGDATGTRSTGT